MKKFVKNASLMICFVLIAAFVTACGPPETITETYSEAEFQSEEFLCLDHGLVVDFQPGKMVCSGTYEGEQVVVDIIPIVEAGVLHFQILRMSVEGEDKPLDDFADMNAELATETYLADEGYVISTVVITDDELTITSKLK